MSLFNKAVDAVYVHPRRKPQIVCHIPFPLSSFIMGPECSSSQMSSPVAEWEGREGLREKREMCVRPLSVCVSELGRWGGLGVDRTKAV